MSGDLSTIEEFMRSAHLATLAACAWLVISADLTAAKSTFRNLSAHDFKRLHLNHRALAWGLAIFWLSGIYLIWNATAFDPAQLSPKLMAKLIVVTILTVNAVVIGRFALPFMERNQSMTFGEFNFEVRWRLALCSGISTASWISAFCLGAIKPLRTASPEVLFEFLGPIYAACCALATLFAIISVSRKPRPDPVAT